ncbi:MAG: hypothetical protein ABH803_00885 [Candidatus Micrarchaeota archaeon]
MNSYVNKFLLLALLTSLVAGLTIDQEAGFYSEPGETPSFSNVSYQGSNYYVIKANGLEVALLDSTFKPVEEDASLTTIIDVYLTNVFDEPSFAQDLGNFKDNFLYTMSKINECAAGTNQFYSMTINQYTYKLYIILAKIDFPKENAAYLTLKEKGPVFQEKVIGANTSYQKLLQSQEKKEFRGVFNALSELKTRLSGIKSDYPSIYEAYINILSPNFPYAFYISGEEQVCEKVEDINTNIDSTLNLIESKYSGPDEILNRIKTQTETRKEKAKTRRINANQLSVIEELIGQYESIISNYTNAGLNLPGLQTEFSSLNATASNNQSNTEQFYNKSEGMRFKLTQYEQILDDYVSAKAQVSEAEENVNEALEKYGSNDERVLALQQELADAKNELQKQEEFLASGSTEGVNMETLAAIAGDLAERAFILQPKENQIDYATIIGVVIIILALVGALIYFKKTREQHPPEIDIRHLQEHVKNENK